MIYKGSKCFWLVEELNIQSFEESDMLACVPHAWLNVCICPSIFLYANAKEQYVKTSSCSSSTSFNLEDHPAETKVSKVFWPSAVLHTLVHYLLQKSPYQHKSSPDQCFFFNKICSIYTNGFLSTFTCLGNSVSDHTMPINLSWVKLNWIAKDRGLDWGF